MTMPLPDGWPCHPCVLNLALRLLLAQDDLLRDQHPLRQALDHNVFEWLVSLVDPDEDLYRLPGNLLVLSALVEAALRTPEAAHLYAVYRWGARVAYAAAAFAERALDELREADLDLSGLLPGDC